MNEPQSRLLGVADSDLLRDAVRSEEQSAAIPLALQSRIFPESQFVFREDDLAVASTMANHVIEQLRSLFEHEHNTAILPDLFDPQICANPEIISHIYARAIEARMCRNFPKIANHEAELPQVLQSALDGANAPLIESAMALLASQSRFLSDARGYHLQITEFPPEILALLVWRTVQNCQSRLQDMGQTDAKTISAIELRTIAHNILRTSDEAQCRENRIQKFIYRAVGSDDDDVASEFKDLPSAAPAIWFAKLANDTGLEYSSLIVMANEPGLSRLAVVLRAAQFDADDAIRTLHNLAILSSNGLNPWIDSDAYAKLPNDDACELVARWSNQQSHFHDRFNLSIAKAGQ